jgi:hypothetical protein
VLKKKTLQRNMPPLPPPVNQLVYIGRFQTHESGRGDRVGFKPIGTVNMKMALFRDKILFFIKLNCQKTDFHIKMLLNMSNLNEN